MTTPVSGVLQLLLHALPAQAEVAQEAGEAVAAVVIQVEPGLATPTLAAEAGASAGPLAELLAALGAGDVVRDGESGTFLHCTAMYRLWWQNLQSHRLHYGNWTWSTRNRLNLIKNNAGQGAEGSTTWTLLMTWIMKMALLGP